MNESTNGRFDEMWSHPPPDSPVGDDRRLLALAGGLAAAVLGGLVWAGVVLYASLEVGWVAWGVGLLVGVSMARITRERSRALGMWAAGIAATGLLVGKLMVTVGSTGAVATAILGDEDWMKGGLAWEMYSDDALPDEITRELDATLAAGDTISDVLWSRMLDAAGPRFAQLNEEEKQELAQAQAGNLIAQLGVVGGVLVQVGPWDLLWFGLAVVTAFQMVAGREVEEAPAV